MSIRNLNRIVGIRDTRSNIISLSGLLEELAISFASDTEEFGIYTNGIWEWFGGTGGSSIVWEPITNGNISDPELIFNNGDVVMNGRCYT